MQADLRSFQDFNVDDFTSSFIKPMISDLITEINLAFDVPEHLKGFAILDPQKLQKM